MRFAHLILLSAISLTLSACSLDNLLDGTDPLEGIEVDPNAVATYEGAVGLYHAALYSMDNVVRETSREVGIFTDELADGNSVYLDGRTARPDDEGVVSVSYEHLQTTRVRAAQASELLLRYGTAASHPLVGHAYGLEAHAVLLLAELLCSGIPLTNAPFEGGMRLSPALPTTTLLERAVALFDTAYMYGKDSLPIATFARVGKGRALLALGKYAEAGDAVDGVPDGARYETTFASSSYNRGVPFWTDPNEMNNSTVLNAEGGNGVRWGADSAHLQDPRVPLDRSSGTFQQIKYTRAAETVVIADWIQARLITAEAQLQPAGAPQGPWLATLNAVRATRGLAPLTDPGNAAERVDLLFQERAFWLYLNGNRLGDMRRLVRNYGRFPTLVYATGSYPFFNTVVLTYGNEYVLVPPKAEQERNYLYTGCIDRKP